MNQIIIRWFIPLKLKLMNYIKHNYLQKIKTHLLSLKKVVLKLQTNFIKFRDRNRNKNNIILQQVVQKDLE